MSSTPELDIRFNVSRISGEEYVVGDKIGFAVDSTIDLPDGMKEDLGLNIIPIHIFVDGQDHLHGVNISNKEVVEYLKQNRDVYTTPYFPSECADIFEKLFNKYDRIISFHISTELSGNFQSALNYLNLLFDDEVAKIDVIDTQNVCIGQGLLVKKAVDSLQKGWAGQLFFGICRQHAEYKTNHSA